MQKQKKNANIAIPIMIFTFRIMIQNAPKRWFFKAVNKRILEYVLQKKYYFSYFTQTFYIYFSVLFDISL